MSSSSSSSNNTKDNAAPSPPNIGAAAAGSNVPPMMSPFWPAPMMMPYFDASLATMRGAIPNMMMMDAAASAALSAVIAPQQRQKARPTQQSRNNTSNDALLQNENARLQKRVQKLTKSLEAAEKKVAKLTQQLQASKRTAAKRQAALVELRAQKRAKRLMHCSTAGAVAASVATAAACATSAPATTTATNGTTTTSTNGTAAAQTATATTTPKSSSPLAISMPTAVLSKHDAKWYQRYQELVAFKQQHGHSQVSKCTYKGTPLQELAAWVSCQRYEYKCLREGRKTAMTSQRVKLLTDLGFCWKLSCGLRPGMKTWEERFEQLVEFHQRYGHTRVPSSSSSTSQPPLDEFKGLGAWVIDQRRSFRGRKKSGVLTPERIQKLQALGFEWSLR